MSGKTAPPLLKPVHVWVCTWQAHPSHLHLVLPDWLCISGWTSPPPHLIALGNGKRHGWCHLHALTLKFANATWSTFLKAESVRVWDLNKGRMEGLLVLIKNVTGLRSRCSLRSVSSVWRVSGVLRTKTHFSVHSLRPDWNSRFISSLNQTYF